jgi:AraC-like DNA-binding protein
VVVDHRPAASVALEAAVVELLAQIARRQGARAARTPPRRLRNARARVHDAQGRESLAELAAAVGVHRAHLARAFRDHYGGTLGGFARRLRVERALRLLAEDDRPLAEIAMDTGFTDQSHMTRAVSAAAGISPGRLRALLRRERATLIQDPRPGAA